MYNSNFYFIIMSFAALLAKHSTSTKFIIRSIEQTSRKRVNDEAAYVLRQDILLYTCFVEDQGIFTFQYLLVVLFN